MTPASGHHRWRRTIGRWSFLGVLSCIAVATPAAVHGSSQPRQVADDRVEISIVRQGFALPADGMLDLAIEITGALPPRLEPDEPADPDASSPTENDAMPPDATEPSIPPGEPTDDLDPPDPWIEIVVAAHASLERRDEVLPAAAGVLGREVSSVRYVLDDEDDHALVELQIPIRSEDTDGEPTGDTGSEEGSADDRSAALVLDRPGLYPVTVDLLHDGQRLTRAITFVERLPADGDPITRTRPYRLVVVANIGDPGPEPEPLDLVDARARLLEILENADAIDEPITVSVPPAVLATLAEDPTIGPRLETGLAGDELVAVPELTLDPSAVARADVGEAFVRELRRGEDVLNAVVPTASTRRSSWITTSAPSTEGAALLRDLGVRLLVVPLAVYHQLEGSLHPGFTDPSRVYPVALPGDGRMNLAVVDPVSRWIDPARSDGRSSTEAAAVALAELSATRIQLRDATRLAVLGTETFQPPDADVLAEIERMTRDHPAFSFETLSFASDTTDSIARGPGSEPVLLPEHAGIDLRPRVLALDESRAHAHRIASMIPDGDPRPGIWSDELDRWLSTGFTDGEIDQRLDAFGAELAAIPASIVPPEPFTFTLTGSESEITLRIINDADDTLRVMIQSEASKLTFPDGDVVVDLVPGTNSVTLPVRTLSNGTFPVFIELRTPDGSTVIAEPVVLRARVNALTGIGQVLTGGLILVLATWWISHLRGERRARRQAARSRSTRRHPCSRTGEGIVHSTAEDAPSDSVGSP